MLRDHVSVLPTGLAVLEDPATRRDAAAVSLQRAADTGHTWLSRLASKDHAGHVVEPALLASVRPPPVSYVPAVPRRLGKTGVLSDLQLEAMMHAGQCHAQPLRPNGSRPGFLLADGAGVGKGRTQASIILDAWLQGHQKALWVSASTDLFADAKRDLQAVCTAIAGTPPLHDLLTNLTSVPQQSPIPAARGVVFASYALLARPGRLAQVRASDTHPPASRVPHACIRAVGAAQLGGASRAHQRLSARRRTARARLPLLQVPCCDLRAPPRAPALEQLLFPSRLALTSTCPCACAWSCAQVLAWCTARTPFQGVLALDECHRAKAAGATGAGSAVLHLQSQLPLARVVYSSATSATELHNLQCARPPARPHHDRVHPHARRARPCFPRP